MIRLGVRIARENAEAALFDLLTFSPAGVEECEIDEGTIEYALYGSAHELPSDTALQAQLPGVVIDTQRSEVPDDWPERWREFHRPTTVAERIHVRAPWHEPCGPGLVELVIEPAQAFGTGAHATTRMCLELLVALERRGEAHGALLDVGCGSGVLAIAAAKLGFAPVIAIDNDPLAVRAAADNAITNAVQLDAQLADLAVDELPAARTVVANLLLEPLLALAARLERMPAYLIASGLLEDQGERLAGALTMRELDRRREGEWLAVLYERGPRVSSQRAMSITDTIKADIATAMKAHDPERVGALRLLLSELQKAAKDGSSDELAVLRRERKRRGESERAYREGGREDLAQVEAREAELIGGYLPAELDDAQLAEIVARAIAQAGASSQRDLGKVMPIAMAEVAGRADGRRVSEQVRDALPAT